MFRDILNSPVLAASVTAFFSFLLGAITIYFKQRDFVTQAKHELEIQSESLDFAAFVNDWGGILKDIESLMNKSTLDRFLIFRAWNGVSNPRWTTAVFQFRKGRQEHISYIHFELDVDYIERLKTITDGKDIYFNVDDIPPSAVKSIYLNEGVKASYWSHLHSKQIDKHSRTITYCSFATMDERGLDENTQTRIKIILGRLRAVAIKAES